MEELEMCPHGRHVGAVCIPCEEEKYGEGHAHFTVDGKHCFECGEKAPEEVTANMKQSGADGKYYDLPTWTVNGELHYCKTLQDVIYYKRMRWNQANALKAVYRWDKKPDVRYNIEKALWFLSYEAVKLGFDPHVSVQNAVESASLE